MIQEDVAFVKTKVSLGLLGTTFEFLQLAYRVQMVFDRLGATHGMLRCEEFE